MAPDRDALLAAAREEFLRHGFRKASVAAIAAQAGMAVGSVYAFYPSKKDLFIEVYTAENNASKKAIIAAVDWNRPRQALSDYILTNLAAGRDNAILGEWNGDAVGGLLQELYASGSLRTDISAFLADSFTRWREEGLLAEETSPDRVDELFTVAEALDVAPVSTETKLFLLDAVLDRLFIAEDPAAGQS